MSLKADIIRVISGRNATLTDFRLFGFRIFGRDYRHIATCIENGQIQVIRARRVVGTLAGYNRRFNCFVVSANCDLVNVGGRCLIVHEATHAINDWHGRNLTATEDEGLAYVASQIYLLRENPQLGLNASSAEFQRTTDQYATVCGQRSRACNTAVIGYATQIAQILIEKRIPPADLLQNYEDTLARDPDTANVSVRRQYNRIKRVEIPQAFLTEVGGEIVTQ